MKILNKVKNKEEKLIEKVVDKEENKKNKEKTEKGIFDNMSFFERIKFSFFGNDNFLFEEPILMLMKEDGDVEILENMVAGTLTYTGGTDEKVTKLLELDPKKMVKIPSGLGNHKYNGWIAYEGDGTAYPSDIIHDTKRLGSIYKRMQINYKDFEESEEGFLKNERLWIYVVGAIILMALIFGNLELIISTIKSFMTEPETIAESFKVIGLQ